MEEVITQVNEGPATVPADQQTKEEVTPGLFIKALRVRKDLSQRQLALALGTTVQFISNLERNVTPIPFEKVALLSQALDSPVPHVAMAALRSSGAFRAYKAAIA